MRKLTRTAILVLMAALVVGATPAFAEESEKAVVKLPSFSLESDYDVDEVSISYSEDDSENVVEAIILDKASGDVLETIRECPDISLSQIELLKNQTGPLRAQSTYTTTLQKDVTITKVNGNSVVATVAARVQITAGTSWAQIDKVISCSHAAGGSGGYTLNTLGTYNGTSKFPTIALKIDFNGVVEIKSTNAVGFTYDALEAVGFSFTGKKESTWYARKSYNMSTTFRVMS